MRQQRKFFLLFFSAGALALIADMLSGGAASEADLLARIISLDANGRFDEAQAMALACLKKEPDAGELLSKYVQDLVETHDEYERAIAVIDQTLPALEKTSPRIASHIADEQGIAIAFGRYGKTRNESDLADAKYAFRHAVRLNPDLYEANFHLGVINAIQGDVKQSTSSFKKAIQTAADPEQIATMKSLLALAEQDPGRYCAMLKKFYFK